MEQSKINNSIAVVIPCYRVKDAILKVIAAIGAEVTQIIVVDDCCPEKSGKFVEENCQDQRVHVVYHQKNKGVGGAVKTGYQKALELNAQIVVKLDGDGQMDPKLIPDLVASIVFGQADYSKGNRFFNLGSLKQMPLVRLFGNSALSFVSKVASGYWNLMDPTNGFTAIHSYALRQLPLDKIEDRYFFESDMLFRLNTVRAVVREFPMVAVYDGENSSLDPFKIFCSFPSKYIERFYKRIFYNYFLRDFNICSLNIIMGGALFLFGVIYGAINWYLGSSSNSFMPTGTIMIAALSIILGFQMLLAAVAYDVSNVPRDPLQEFSR
ncbi:MAG: glycosyltransferase family 2 protein [Deltaproteobacteria bacterium]|nr:glycosyltransferase family 2 protein [Deltaproteobacteria bacterium]